jgi:effector-binding domain-containing protein
MTGGASHLLLTLRFWIFDFGFWIRGITQEKLGMIDALEIVQTEKQPTAVIRLKVSREEIQQVMGLAIGEVMAAVSSQGVGPAGPVFSHHFKVDPKTFDFEVGVPVSKPVQAVGRVQAGELPAARVARTTYQGGYEGLGSAWSELMARLANDGHKPAENLWERYVCGPESSPDSSQWRTELNRPLVDA